MDRDGSNRRLIFPAEAEIGIQYPEMAWAPAGSLIVVVYQENLVLIRVSEGGVYQLTNVGGVTAVRWQGAVAESAEGDEALLTSERVESD
jgi:hypothetical protein